MRIGLLITSIGNFGQKDFYNAQEIGLAKALDKIVDEVIVYKAVPMSESNGKNIIEGCVHSTLYQVPVKNNGISGIWDCSVMDTSLDAVIYFSDTQMSVPKVYKWCCQNNIKMYPYIGVIESHSSSRIKKLIINALLKRNVAIYKKCTCFVKTPTVAKCLSKLGIKNTVLTPVGLDISLLNTNYEKVFVEEIKKKYGYTSTDKVLLFIGRLINEKQPIRMIEILSELRIKDQTYKLLIVGKGKLRDAIEKRIKILNLTDCVQMIERMPNSEIWELYRMADALINLNQQEIFGMAILEAMYYGCKVVAWKAPGPDLIIENGKSGWLATRNDEVIKYVLNTKNISKYAHTRIITNFTWESSAKTMCQQIRRCEVVSYG